MKHGTIRVTKEFTLEMAHALAGYDGRCKDIHGHSYKLFVTIIGTIDNDPKSPKNGMVIDFNILKDIVNKAIINEFDHALVLNANSQNISILNSQFSILTVPYQPTCENLLLDFAKRIQKEIINYESSHHHIITSSHQDIKLYKLKLSETATSFAEWYASDNQ